MAELLVEKGCSVTLVTPANCVSEWTVNTLEQGFIQARLIDKGITLATSRRVNNVANGHVRLGCTYSGREEDLQADAVVMVTARDGNDTLWHELKSRQDEWQDAGIKSVKIIGDAEAPAPIAWATYAGHRYAMEMDTEGSGDEPCFRREVAALEK